MTYSADYYLSSKIIWTKTSDAEYPYSAHREGEKLVVRLNDFPAEAMYTLLVSDSALCDFDDWPKSWSRPAQA